MNKKAILVIGVCISFLLTSCENKNDKETTEKNSIMEVTSTEVKTSIQYTETVMTTETESVTEIESEVLSDNIDLDKEKDALLEYAESFIIEYVNCVKEDKYNTDQLFDNIQNEKLKKYIQYTINNKSYVVLNVPDKDTKCFFEDVDIKKLDDKIVCVKSNVIFCKDRDYKKTSSGAGMVYVVLIRSDGKNIIGDMYWDVLDSPDVVYRKENNPYQNYIDFWNDENKVKKFYSELGI